MEQWKRVFDWNYEASDQGRVRNLKGRILFTRHIIDSRYTYVTLHVPCVGRKPFSVARLVLLAFVGSGIGKRIRYKNGDLKDMRLANLEWADPEGRTCYVYHDDTSRPTKLTWEQVQDIRRRWKENTQLGIADLARMFYVDTATISRIVYDRCWKKES